eukprot:1036436-Prorocentrum_minimum.AAC.1
MNPPPVPDLYVLPGGSLNSGWLSVRFPWHPASAAVGWVYTVAGEVARRSSHILTIANVFFARRNTSSSTKHTDPPPLAV